MSRLIDATELNGYKFGLISPYAQKLFHAIINNAPTVNAIIIPKGATNGDMIKVLFPGIVVEAVKLDGEIIGYDISNLDDGTCAETYFTEGWWNASYKKEVEE